MTVPFPVRPVTRENPDADEKVRWVRPNYKFDKHNSALRGGPGRGRGGATDCFRNRVCHEFLES